MSVWQSHPEPDHRLTATVQLPRLESAPQNRVQTRDGILLEGRSHVRILVEGVRARLLANEERESAVTEEFAKTAKDYAKSVSQRVILIDGNRLGELLIEHNIGATTAYTVSVKRIDSDYFEDD
jgi:hypothetical protein